MIGQSKTNSIAVIFFFFSFLSPDIYFHSKFAAFQISDFLLPLLFYSVWKERDRLFVKQYILFLAVFCLVIFISMILNNRLTHISDYFEIYKFFKFGIVLAFFSLISFDSWKKIILPTGIALMMINLLHFFEVGSVNDFLINYYSGDLNLKFFGKNTLYEISSKRMVGVMGNPNTNSILFAIFSFYFLNLSSRIKNRLFFFVFLTLTFMCQSRTTLIALIVILTYFLIHNYKNLTKKYILFYLAGISVAYFSAWFFCSRYFEYPIYGNSMINGAALESQSAMGRLESWKFLGEMILEKPILGYGPNKTFFYENKIYSENEYVLYLWRYGFIGLFFYLALYLFPLKMLNHKPNKSNNYLFLVMCTLLFLISAITNNPFTDRFLMIMFAILLGTTFHVLSLKNKINDEF